MTTYKIVRFHFKAENEIIQTGLTLAEAQAHCNREDTHGDGWFDGYEKEGHDADAPLLHSTKVRPRLPLFDSGDSKLADEIKGRHLRIASDERRTEI